MVNGILSWRRMRPLGLCLLAAAALITGHSTVAVGTGPAPSLLISQVPLTVTIPSHPQVVFALGNSESMDGNLSGAVMTGSGSLPTAIAAGLAASSSPADYTIPSGFTPPANPGAGGLAPYTVTNSNNTLVDNSPSRLNVAKAGVSAIVNAFMQYADFALMDYQATSVGEYTTWSYYMSYDSGGSQGFTFTDNPFTNSTNWTVTNPCFDANTAATDAYSEACAALETNYGDPSGVIADQYMVVGATSDDSSINDVFYGPSTWQPPVCLDELPAPGNPYTAYNLASYETGTVLELYEQTVGAAGYSYTCDPGMAPTNAGYIAYSSQVMQMERGFGYDAGGQSATTGSVVVPMQSSGAEPTPQSVATAIAAFTPYLQPETADPTTTEVKSVAEQSPLAGLVEGAAQYFSSSDPTSTTACAPTRYIVLVTDGLPTEDLSGHSWPPLGTAAAQGYGVTASFSGNGTLASTNDQALTDAINQISAATSEGIKTYVIGLGAGVDASINPSAAATLEAMAIAGGTVNFFPADSPTSLANQMQAILAQIVAASRSTASATVNTTGLNTNSMAFQPSFTTADVDQDWTGDIKAYPINPATGTVNTSVPPQWDAQTQLDQIVAANGNTGWNTGRIIATWDPVANNGIPFRWTFGSPTSGIGQTTALGQELETNTADPLGHHALEYLRGDAARSVVDGGAYRNRSHILADIVDSAPLYIAAPAGAYQSSTYYTFENTYANRAPVLYVGANDGMLHAISASTGKELFAYVPNGVFPKLIQLTNPYYNQEHQFFVDGSAQAADVQFSNGQWHTELVSGEGGGGNTIFALDVTNPQAITTEAQLSSKVLWEFSDPNMGLTYSTPAIAQTAYGASGSNLGFTVFFGNGYNSPSQTPYLYAVDPATGQSLPGTPINLCAAVAPQAVCSSSLPNGLSNVVVTNNLGGVGAPATTLYAGDLQGNVWRVDIRDPNPANWVVTVLFQATDPSGNPQPITTTPAVSLNPDFPRLAGTLVYVGTGELLSTTDISSTQIQTMYGIYDSGANPQTYTRSNLIQQTLSTEQVSGQTLRLVNGSQIEFPAQLGWFVDFDLPGTDGERIVSDPRLVGGALAVISVQPSASGTQTSMATPPHDNRLGTGPSAPELARAAPEVPQLSAPPAARTLPTAYNNPGRLNPSDLSALLPPQARSGLYFPGSSTAHLWQTGSGVTVINLVVSPASQSITVGSNSSAYTATAYFSNGTNRVLTNSEVTWSSSATSIATINSSGVATGLSQGGSEITVSFDGSTASASLAVVNPPPLPTLTGIVVSPTSSTINIGGTQGYTVYTTWSNGTEQPLSASMATWSSSSTGIATVSSSGVASGIAAGTTVITATYDGYTANANLTVITPIVAPPVTVTSFYITPGSASILVGGAQSFNAVVTYSNGTWAYVTASSTWTSSTTSVATIAGTGVATGVTPGGTTITATWMGNTATATLTVGSPPAFSGFYITPASATTTVGATVSFTSTAQYTDGFGHITTQTVTTASAWSSSATTIASITSPQAVATGVAVGSVTITAVWNGHTATAALTVNAPPTLRSITVTPTSASILVGATQTYTAIGNMSNGTTENLTSLAAWTVTSAAASITGGLATGLEPGVATVRATYDGLSGTATLTVSAQPAAPPPTICPGGDISYLMEFNYAGGSFSTPVFNYLGSSAPTTSLVPANGVLLGGVYASAPVFVGDPGSSTATGGNIGLITLSNGSISSYFQIGLQRQRFAWWEVR